MYSLYNFDRAEIVSCMFVLFLYLFILVHSLHFSSLFAPTYIFSHRMHLLPRQLISFLILSSNVVDRVLKDLERSFTWRKHIWIVCQLNFQTFYICLVFNKLYNIFCMHSRRGAIRGIAPWIIRKQRWRPSKLTLQFLLAVRGRYRQ